MGLGSPHVVPTLIRLIRLEKSDVVFLMETRLKDAEFQNGKFNSGFDCCLVVDCVSGGRDRGGGIALLWKEQTKLTILFFYLNHIA